MLACATRALTAVSRKDAQLHVECYVCNLMVHEAHSYMKQNELKVEDDVADMIDGLCSTKRKEGRWVASTDILMHHDDTLIIQRMKDLGECRKECQIIQKSCLDALEEEEDTLKTMLLEEEAVPKMQRKFCKDTCKRKAKGKLPKLNGWEDEEFKVIHASFVKAEDEFGPTIKRYDANEIMSWSDHDQKLFFIQQEKAELVRRDRERAET